MDQYFEIDEEMVASMHMGIKKNANPVLGAQKQKSRTTRNQTHSDIVTEDSAACQFAKKYSGRLRYCHDTRSWFVWNGSIWQPDRTSQALHWARELARELSMSKPDKVRCIMNKTSFSSGMEWFSRADPALCVTAEVWDRDPFLLGTPSGTVDLKSGRLRESDASDGITRSAAAVPIDLIRCPLWLKFLDDATGGDAGLIQFLQLWCGLTLTGSTREHSLVFIYGPGGNGKSVFLNVLTQILGTYATTAAMDTFTASKSDKHPAELAMLRGARLVTASETEDGKPWAEARIKQMTGGDPISARFMHKDFFTYTPQFKLTIVGNHKPVLKNVDDAIKRRFNIVPFTLKPECPDPQLEEKLKAEYPGILRWMIEGCRDWQAHGLIRPACVVAATEDYFDEQDLFGQWLQDVCDAEPGNTYKTESSAILFRSWRCYAERAGETAGSTKAFSESLKRRGFELARTSAARGFKGIRLKPSQSFEHDG